MFATAVAQASPGVLPLLLVDSEDPVREGHSVWQHLKACDGWERRHHKAALEANAGVALFLFGLEELPDRPPQSYSPGDENEAALY